MRIPFFSKTKEVDESAGHVAGMRINAGFDAAAHNPQDERHWINADGMSADAVASSEVRRLLRNRSRYEVANNCYAIGFKTTIVDHTIGTGPRVQITSTNEETSRKIERSFGLWAAEIGFAEKLRTFRGDKFQSGEGFGILSRNPRLRSRNKTDIVMIEADQVTSPYMPDIDDSVVDGIEYDVYGNPVFYTVLKDHPGSDVASATLESTQVKASSMIHYYRANRPGQSRGIPEISPALPILSQLRRLTKATLSAAELAASVSMFMQTDSPPNGESAAVKNFSLVDIEPGIMMTLPAGWKIGQVRSEQPATMYPDAKNEFLNEAARAIGMPFNLAAGNSSNYNYASGRLDHQTYFQAIKVEREFIERVILNRVFRAWYAEEVLLQRQVEGGMIGVQMEDIDAVDLSWFWDGFDHVDPLKEANAQATKLESRTTTLKTEYGRQGKDWRVEVEQLAKEQDLMNKLGLVPVVRSEQKKEDPTEPPAQKKGSK